MLLKYKSINIDYISFERSIIRQEFVQLIRRRKYNITIAKKTETNSITISLIRKPIEKRRKIKI